MSSFDGRLRWWLRLALLIMGSCGSLLGFEVGFRAWRCLSFDSYLHNLELPPPSDLKTTVNLAQIIRPSSNPKLVYELIPGAKGKFEGVAPLEINPDGFRSLPFDPEKEPQEFRILGIGDSVMFGWKVAFPEMYTTRLMEALNRRGKETRFTFYNLAVPGYNTCQEAELLLSKGLAHQPDVIIMDLIGNDAQSPIFQPIPPSLIPWDNWLLADFFRRRFLGMTEERQALTHVPPEESPEPLLLTERERKLFAGIFSEDFLEAGKSEAFSHDNAPAKYREMVGWENVLNTYRKISEQTVKKGVPVLVGYYYLGPLPLKQRIAEMGFQVFDILHQVFDRLDRSGGSLKSFMFSETDPHPSAFGHKLIAQVWETELARLDLLQMRDLHTAPGHVTGSNGNQ